MQPHLRGGQGRDHTDIENSGHVVTFVALAAALGIAMLIGCAIIGILS